MVLHSNEGACQLLLYVPFILEIKETGSMQSICVIIKSTIHQPIYSMHLIQVSSPIPFKTHLHSRHGGFAIYIVEFASGKTERISREETESWTIGPFLETEITFSKL